MHAAKKILIALLAAAMILSLASCKQETPQTSSADQPTSSAAQAAPSQTETPSASSEQPEQSEQPKQPESSETVTIINAGPNPEADNEVEFEE